MKKISIIFLVTVFASCNSDKKIIVDKIFVDSLINNYGVPAAVRMNADEIEFWMNRINPKNSGIINESKYSGTLVARFNLLGDINDVKTADSVLKKIDIDYNHKEAGPVMALVSHAILQHQFKNADSLLASAKVIGLKKYESVVASFDVDFELGRYSQATLELNSIKTGNDYDYYFRKSKLEHYKGNIDSSIAAMLKAAERAGENIFLKQTALSNAADLYIHSGDLQKAYALYVHCIRLNAADLHSLMGIGWIALAHDKDDSLAEKIFLFVHTKTKAPDVVFKLAQVAEARGDSALQVKYANEFASRVTDTAYGNMYNKYLIELYTSSLNNPAKAEMVAAKELQGRATPQTYAWYAWSLFSNNKKDEAYNCYQKYVAAKPLEGLELFYMGKFMQGMKKGYNAQQFFKAAYDNRYDLSPEKVKDLQKDLK